MKNYLDNVVITPELIGLEMSLNPGLANDSSPRCDMLHGHLPQALITHGREMPYIFSGNEYNIGQYEFDEAKRDQDAMVLAVIPKFRAISGINQIKYSPYVTVIYQGLEDKQIHYFNLKRFTLGSEGYGYMNKMLNWHTLTPGAYLEKDTKLYTSPAHEGNMYMLGRNANVVNMTMLDTTEDAFKVSRSFAESLTTDAFYTNVITVQPDQHPLNLYGDDGEFKFMPDVGEQVREDGILCGFRTPTESTYMSDLLEESQRIPQRLHDTVFSAPPGATILDVNFRVAAKDLPKRLYSQIDKYTEETIHYHTQIFEVYNEYKDKYKVSPEFNTLITNTIKTLNFHNQKIKGLPRCNNLKLVDKDDLIDFIQIEVTYTTQLKFNHGFKLTDRHGAKGIVSNITEDEDMPIDEYGFRADVAIAPSGTVDRQNSGQQNEEGINRVSEFVRRMLTPDMKGWNLLLEYFNDINPNYAQLTKETYVTQDERITFVKQAIEKGIYLNIPPGLNTITPKLFLYLRDKYKVGISPVSFNIIKKNGEKKRVVTKKPVCIGSKYFYVLYNIPNYTCSASGIGYINQYNTPVKPGQNIKKQLLTSRTPIRFLGEDDTRILTQGGDSAPVVRVMSLLGTSSEGTVRMVEANLTAPKPTRIHRIPITDQELIESNTILGIAHHMYKTIGIETRHTLRGPLTKKEKDIILSYYSHLKKEK